MLVNRVPARLTNDRWMSTLHRVRPPVVDGTIRRRRSVAYFHDGNVDAVISTLPSHREVGGDPAYELITVRDHIHAKLAGSRQARRTRPLCGRRPGVLAAGGQVADRPS